jgi:hypothetical protein
MSSLRSWESVKDRVHDISGIENPENWLYESKDGIFYPVEDLGEDVTSDEQKMFDELDPDWTDEEMEQHGYIIKCSITIGSDDVVDYREGCGHMVMETVEPKEVKRVGFI